MRIAKKGGESARHQALKEAGKEWLRQKGCGVLATEVRLPLSPYRADVGGYRRSGRMGMIGDTFAVECKQSRADFLRDASSEQACRQGLESVGWEVESLRRLLQVHLPDCRLGESLFSDLDTYDFSDLRHEKWRRLLARLACLERKLDEGVKFSRLVRYGAVHYLYLLTSEGVVEREGEVPLGWGWLLHREDGTIETIRTATRLRCRSEAALAFLERVAARAGR